MKDILTRRFAVSLFAAVLAPALCILALAFPATVTDDTGATIRLPRRPERLVSLTPSATEILFALGLDDEIVGVTNYCDYPPAARDKNRIGDINLDYEKIVSLRPDLLVAVGNMPAASLDRLRGLGLTLLAFAPTDLSAVMDAVERIGVATGRSAVANRVVQAMEERAGSVAGRLAGLPETARPRVFVEIWMDPVMTAGPGTFTAELIQMAGGRDIAWDAQPWSPFSQELVIARNPQVIISQCESAAQIKTRPGWGGIEAVREGRVYDVDQNIFSRPGPRLVEALETLARLLHPKRFAR